MNSIIPIFKSHYSIGKSILTLEKSGKSKPNTPHSIIDIAQEYNLDKVVLIDESFSGFLEAYTNLLSINKQLIFGLRITCLVNSNEKNEESLKREHKVIVCAKNYNGYKKLIKLYTKAATNIYYVPRISDDEIKDIWDENDLALWIPFYDSYIHNNLLKNHTCIPHFDSFKPTYLIEDNGLFLDSVLQSNLKDFKTMRVKSIYYKYKKDFINYMTFRCISNRTTLDKPELRGMSSNRFCIEAWKEDIDNEKNI